MEVGWRLLGRIGLIFWRLLTSTLASQALNPIRLMSPIAARQKALIRPH